MPSVNATIAEAVKASLNAGTFSEEFTATRRPIPSLNLATMGDDMYVTVCPRADNRSNAARRVVRRDIDIDIGIQKRLTTDCDPESESGNVEIDALMAFAEAIADHFTPDMSPLTGTAGHWVRTAHEPIHDQEEMLTRRCFASLVTVTFVLFDT